MSTGFSHRIAADVPSAAWPRSGGCRPPRLDDRPSPVHGRKSRRCRQLAARRRDAGGLAARPRSGSCRARGPPFAGVAFTVEVASRGPGIATWAHLYSTDTTTKESGTARRRRLLVHRQPRRPYPYRQRRRTVKPPNSRSPENLPNTRPQHSAQHWTRSPRAVWVHGGDRGQSAYVPRQFRSTPSGLPHHRTTGTVPAGCP